MPTQSSHRDVMISSTISNLAEYRECAKDAVWKANFFPRMMEGDGAKDQTPVQFSLDLVEKSNVYIGIFGHRYGSVPEGHDISITEMELRAAEKKGIPILIFILDDNYNIPVNIASLFDYFETDPGRKEKLNQLKSYLKNRYTVDFFTTPTDLEAKVSQAISKLASDKNVSEKNQEVPSGTTFLGTHAVGIYDRTPVLSHSMKDLDRNLVENFLNSPRSQEFLRDRGLLRKSIEEQLQKLGILIGQHPTLGAFLSFAPYDQIIDKFTACGLSLSVYEGGSKTTKIYYSREKFGNLIELFDYGMEFFSNHLRQVGIAGSVDRDDLEVPIIALREALANALVHRKYEHPSASNQPTQIDIFADRIDIVSFGGLEPGVNIDWLNNQPEKIVNVRRNPVIAQIFLHLALVELKGSGIARIHEVCLTKGLSQPRIIQTEGSEPFVKLTLYRPPSTSLAAPTNSSLLPPPPNPYMAHPYILTRQFFGRKSELKILDDWATSPASTLIFEAIGGMGKSALTWHWMNHHAKDRIPNLAGVIWWSFHESDGSLPNFAKHALAYVTGQPTSAYDKVPLAERQRLLVDALRQKPYLLVLDGLERILVAYNTMLAPMKSDDEVEAERQTTDDAHLRSCTDPRHGDFLRALAGCTPSRVLISTRLKPHDLEDKSRQLLPGIAHHSLRGIYPPSEALELLRFLGVKGDGEAILRFTNQFDNHPLILQVLAGLVTGYRPAPGDFETWYAEEGNGLRLSDLDISQRRTGILQTALNGLDAEGEYLLGAVAAFRYPVEYKALVALNPYLETDAEHAQKRLSAALGQLEDRGLLQWDRQTNRYDLHPVVRAYAFERMNAKRRAQVYERIRDHFSQQPEEDLAQVKEVDDLRRSLEIYYALLGAGLLDEVAKFYRGGLSNVLLYELNASTAVLELLRPLFPDGFAALPALRDVRDQSYIVNDLSIALGYLGRDEESLAALALTLQIDVGREQASYLRVGLTNYGASLSNLNWLARAARTTALALRLAEAQGAADQIAPARYFQLSDAVKRGDSAAAETAYQAYQAAPVKSHHQAATWAAWVAREYAVLAIQQGQPARERLAEAARLAALARDRRTQADIEHWRGEAALNRGAWAEAVTYFSNALAAYRKINRPTAEVCCRLALICVKQGDANVARDWLEQAAVKPEYGSISAAEVYHALGDVEQCKAYLLPGYKFAWADGPPHINGWELERARKLIAALGLDEAAIQQQLGCTPFDPSKVEKIPYEDEIVAFIERLEQAKAKREAQPPDGDGEP